MKTSNIGHFEEQVLMMVAILNDNAYGKAIVHEIKSQIGKQVSLSAVHVTLYRLEDKGYVRSTMGGVTKTRGGRRKRLFTITNAGMALLRDLKQTREVLWKLIPQLRLSYS